MKSDVVEAFLAMLFVWLVVAALIVVGPIFTIWAVNCLFGLSIPLNVWTWLASLWLMAMVKTPQQLARKSDK